MSIAGECSVIGRIFDAIRHRFFKMLGAEFAYPGHFYSVVPSRKDRRAFLSQPNIPIDSVPGIDIDDKAMMQRLQSFRTYYDEHWFPEEKTEGLRYYYRNTAFEAGDALALYFMIRAFRPRRVIEIGSGFSSAACLDINDHCCNGRMHVTFIEPYPERLLSLLREEDVGKYELVRSRLQDMDVSVFEQLEAGDILFIDSTHVAKLGSDVNRIIFDILPLLKQGVVIHIHDIFWPFEYPKAWVQEGRAWNEAYLLRAFLQFNSHFDIIYFADYVAHRHHSWLQEHMPLLAEHPGGNLWLRKVQ